MVRAETGLRVVGEAYSGEEAVEKMRELRPDLILMDIILPQMNGVDATRVILDEEPKIKVLALSNYSNRALVHKALQAGARGYVRKDHAFEELLDAIRAIVGGGTFIGAGIDPTVAP